MLRVACALIINNEGRLLAVQRSQTMSLPLKWEFPGGKIEQNESPEDCLIREIKEELDIYISIASSLPSTIHQYPTFTINLIPFICQHVSGELILFEHNDFKWFTTSELLDLDWAEADLPVLRHYLNL